LGIEKEITLYYRGVWMVWGMKWCNMVRKSINNKFYGLNITDKLSSRDLASNTLSIIRGKLGKTILIGVFIISVHLFLDYIYTRLP